MGLKSTPHATRISCDCGEPSCDATGFVSYSLKGTAIDQAKSAGWRRKKRGDVYWTAPGHTFHWERAPK